MIFFLYGEDSFRISQKIAEIKNKFLVSDMSGSGLSVFDYSEKGNRHKLLDVLNMPNLLAPKRLVIAKNLIEAGEENEKENILDYLEKHTKQIQEDKDLVIMFQENGQPKKNGRLYKFLIKIAKSQNIEKLSGMKLSQWIVQKIEECNYSGGIGKEALEKLIAFVGNDAGMLDMEIQKLANFADGRMIQAGDVEALVKANVDTNIFNTIDAIANNNKKEALRLLQEHLAQGEVPFQIWAMFIDQFRNLMKVADLKDQYFGNEYEIAKAAGLHPYVVKKSLSQIRSFSYPKLKNIYQRLADLDMQIKTGKIDIKLAMDKFIVEL